MTAHSHTVTEHPTATELPAGQRMRAIVQKEYGTADVLAVAEIERPVIGADEVLVQVHAAGLDRGTWHLMAGLPYAARLGLAARAEEPCPWPRCGGSRGGGRQRCHALPAW